jgi:hypothetical protein
MHRIVFSLSFKNFPRRVIFRRVGKKFPAPVVFFLRRKKHCNPLKLFRRVEKKVATYENFLVASAKNSRPPAVFFLTHLKIFLLI